MLTFRIGCIELCGGDLGHNDLQPALGIVATWVFPLAIVINLPFESQPHDFWGTVCNTIVSTLAWFGSPITAMIAVVYEAYQIWLCSRKSRAMDKGRKDQYWKKVFYVLICFNQLDFSNPDDPNAVPYRLRQALIYGLLAPVAPLSGSPPPGHEQEQAQVTLKEHGREQQVALRELNILVERLRLAQGGNVKRSLLGLIVFFAAFCFSGALAFADTDESTTIFILALGLLYCWLPMLVMFASTIPSWGSESRP